MGRDLFSTRTTLIHILAVIMLHQHTFCVKETIAPMVLYRSPEIQFHSELKKVKGHLGSSFEGIGKT